MREEQEKRKMEQENDTAQQTNPTVKSPGSALASVIMESEETETDQQPGASASG